MSVYRAVVTKQTRETRATRNANDIVDFEPFLKARSLFYNPLCLPSDVTVFRCFEDFAVEDRMRFGGLFESSADFGVKFV